MLLILGLAVSVSASGQTNAVHVWTLKSGGRFTGDYFTSGVQMVVIKSHGTNCLLKITDLTTNDWLYFQECKSAVRQCQLDAESAQMLAGGKIEFTAKLIDNFPEKAANRQGWMDAKFDDLSDIGLYGRDKDYLLGFRVEDKNGDSYYCTVFKKDPHTDQPAPELAEVMKLKKGDRVRFWGCPVEEDIGSRRIKFCINHVEMIQTAAEAAEIEAMKPNEGFKFPER